jgi:hypothetical protein
MINTKLQSIIDTKSAIGNAIVNKGGTITSETPFFNYAAQIDGISTGTPQTIFQASDGSKWALTNVVNLTNVSNNVTSDFNYWQPANNSTSDPILNVGTVNGNISGNIKIVQVNQVNIAQYSNIVINDTTGAKYVGYNGYDVNNNPTPTGNVVFNRWVLNNSASGTVIFANTTVTNGGTFKGPNITTNEANMPFVSNSANYGNHIETMAINNGFVFIGGRNNIKIQKFYETNLVFVGNTVSYTGTIRSVTTNNGFIYAGGAGESFGPASVSKYYESNLVLVGNSVSYNGQIYAQTTNNGFLYVGGTNNTDIKKYHESNLVFNISSNSYGGQINTLKTNNGFVYIGGENNLTVQKFHESNLAFVGNTPSYGGIIRSLSINNGFIFVGGDPSNRAISKFYESNLTLVGNTVNYKGEIRTVTTNNGFIYAGGTSNQTVQKFYENNLAFVGNPNTYASEIKSIIINNSFIYAGGAGEQIKKWAESNDEEETLTFYTVTKIKE